MTPVAVDLRLTSPQAAFWKCADRYVDLEGGVRSGKTTIAILRLGWYAEQYPGIPLFAGRWTQDATDMQLKAKVRELLGAMIQGWDAAEQCFTLQSPTMPRPSLLYVRGLKPAEDAARYTKIAGLTLAVIYVDQPEEMPADFHPALQARLSAVDFPHQLIYTPNPPPHGHWLEVEFPEDNSRPNRRYFRTSVYDNRAALGEEYISDLEAAYTAPALRRFFIEGRRGLAVSGEPVYGGYFSRSRHARPVTMNGQLPLLESWDYGHSHPCVVWAQLPPWGEVVFLGGVMGEGMFIEEFAPLALQYRAQWFPSPLEVWSTGDPAGEAKSSQGMTGRVVDVLAEHGVHIRSVLAANQPVWRDRAIQLLAGYMTRGTNRGEKFQIDPDRWMVVTKRDARAIPFLVDGFEAGYVWDDRALTNAAAPNTRRPRKDGFYDHGQNCCEYLVLAYAPAQPSKVDEAKVQRQADRRAQRDRDPFDRPRIAARAARGGY